MSGSATRASEVSGRVGQCRTVTSDKYIEVHRGRRRAHRGRRRARDRASPCRQSGPRLGMTRSAAESGFGTPHRGSWPDRGRPGGRHRLPPMAGRSARARYNGDVASNRRTGIRARIWRAAFKVRALRHFYARRLLSYMERSQQRRRPLPPELLELRQMLSRVPPHLRLARLEDALRARDQELSSRQLRRALVRQERKSGRRGGRRPGTVMSRQWQPPPRAAIGAKPASRGRNRG
jgi:hypothetical protein